LLIYYYNNKLLMFRMPAHHNPDVVTSFSKSAMLHINIADFFISLSSIIKTLK